MAHQARPNVVGHKDDNQPQFIILSKVVMIRFGGKICVSSSTLMRPAVDVSNICYPLFVISIPLEGFFFPGVNITD